MTLQFSWQRLWAIILKEFIQMKRDRFTFGMMMGIPVLQLILFGYAINSNPKYLPTAVVSADQSIFTRNIIVNLQNSGYFRIIEGNQSDAKANDLLRRGEVQFVVYFPPNFSKQLVHGEKPQVLIEADATDPAATSNALGTIKGLTQIIAQSFSGSLNFLNTPDPPINFVTQLKYNPEQITQYNVVPGLLGVVLTMTMVMITALAITRERERGTMESLLAMPVRPLEVMLGKLTPYIVIGYIQVIVILFVAAYIFSVPMDGSLILLFIACLPFIVANLAVGLTFSTIAKNQLQALQSSVFFFLPSILLSGFMFPFHGMPEWAQVIGNCLPLTHFLVIVRGILLKGNGISEIIPSVEAILVFFLVMIVVGVKRYRQTLD